MKPKKPLQMGDQVYTVESQRGNYYRLREVEATTIVKTYLSNIVLLPYQQIGT